jgi:hypothetical protein
LEVFLVFGERGKDRLFMGKSGFFRFR